MGTVDQAADTVSGSHTYTADGVYTVKVTVKDNNNDTGNDTLIVIVGAAVELLMSPSDLEVGIGLDDLNSTGDIILKVEGQ